MPGDYSRNTFDPAKHYTRIRMQEGRVQLDSDYNENSDDLLHRIVAETRDVIGPSGSPRYGGGFAVSKTPDSTDLTLSAGDMYVDGILVELDGETVRGTTTAGQQSVTLPKLILDGRPIENGDWLDIKAGNAQVVVKVASVAASTGVVSLGAAIANTDNAAIVRRATTYLTQPDFDPQPIANGKYVAYLVVWEREVSALDDPEIREVALGGPDTARRMQTVFQVRLRALNPANADCDGAKSQLDAALTTSTGMLAARTAPVLGETDPCLLPPTAGYLGMENQLYRIEIHRGGTVTAANPNDRPTFKWSRDNASLEVGIDTISGRDLTVREIGKDDLFRFENDQWVEIADDTAWRTQTPNPLRQIDNVNPATRTITLKTNPPATVDQHRKLRRWNQQNSGANQDGVEISGTGWNPIEYGVEVAFAEGVYQAGDYWEIPARTATHDIEWQRFNDVPEHEPPRGIARHYASLAIVEVTNGQIGTITDCRKLFPPLTHICADDVCFDPSHCQFPPNVRTVQQAIDQLCGQQDLRFLYKYFFGLGIVCGLQLVCKGGLVVSVKPGYALDCEGRLIHIPGPNPIDVDLSTLPEWPSVQNQDSVYLSIARGGANGYEFHLHGSGSAQPVATTGIIEGTISDANGSVLPGVTVTIHNTGTNADRVQVTDSEGRFRAPSLPPGQYEVQADFPGFAQHVVIVTLAAGQTRRIDIQIIAGPSVGRVVTTAPPEPAPAPQKGNNWLDGTPLMDAYEDCFKSVTDYINGKFKPDDTNPNIVSENQKRLIAAWNLLVQLYNPTSGRKVFVSRAEHELLAQVYNDLRNLLKMSSTYCALGTVPDFPAYPFSPNLPETIWFGKGTHSKLRTFENFTYTFGSDNSIDVFDHAAGAMVQHLTFPDLGSAVVRDVAIARDSRRLHATADFNGKSYIATYDPSAASTNRWTHAAEITFGSVSDRVASLAAGLGPVEVYGLGDKSIYKINPANGNAQTAIRGDASFALAGHFVVKNPLCAAATRVLETTPSGKYDSITVFSILNGELYAPRRFPLGGVGDEGIGYSTQAAGDNYAVYGVLDSSGSERRRLVTIDSAENPFVTELPHQEGRVSIVGLHGRQFLGAAVAFSDAYETRFHFVAEGRVAEFTPAILPTQICPSAVAIGLESDVLVLNHAVATIARFDESVYLNPNPVDIPTLKNYRNDVVEKFKHLFVLMAESMKDCFCEHFLIDCPTCTPQDIVYLGCLELETVAGERRVRRICSLEKRQYVLSPRLIRYWLTYVPVIPVASRLIEAFCCLDIPRIFEDRIKLPDDGSPDSWACPQIGTLANFKFTQFTRPFQNLFRANLSKLPVLRDLFFHQQPTNGWTPVIKPVEVFNQPVDVVRARFENAGIPVAAIEKFDSNAGFTNFARAKTEFAPGQPVILVEHDGVVAYAHDRVSPAQVETLRADVGKAVTAAEEAKASTVDAGAIRNEIADVQRRVAAVESKPDDTMTTIAREITRARDDIRKEVGDDVERLRARIEEARRIVDDRDNTIRTLTGTIEKLQVDLQEARKFQTDAEKRFETINGQVAAIDELRTLVGRLRPGPLTD